MSTIQPKFKDQVLTGNYAASAFNERYPQRVPALQMPRRHGLLLAGTEAINDQKRITVRGMLYGTDHDDVMVQLDALCKQLYSYGEDKLWLENDRYIWAVLETGRLTRQRDRLGRLWEYGLTFASKDPYWYETSSNTDTNNQITWTSGYHSWYGQPNEDSDGALGETTYEKRAQLFYVCNESDGRLPHKAVVNRVSIEPSANVGSPTFVVKVELIKWSDKSVLASTTVAAATWDAAIGSTLSIALQYDALEPETEYAIVFSNNAGGGSGSDYRRLRYNSSIPGNVPEGNMAYYNGASWTEEASNTMKISINEPYVTVPVTNNGNVETPVLITVDYGAGVADRVFRYYTTTSTESVWLGWEGQNVASQSVDIDTADPRTIEIAGADAISGLVGGSTFVHFPPGSETFWFLGSITGGNHIEIEWTERYH
jgi:hypothetical protein